MKLRTLALSALLLAPVALHAQAGQVVGPSCAYLIDPACRGSLPTQQYGQDLTSATPRDWWADIQGGYAQVTTNNPRTGFGGYGSGSLELQVQGASVTNGSNEWAFWYRFAGGASYEYSTAASYGQLSQLSSLSFDWFRTSDPTWNSSTPSADWPYKTPVMRLRLLETDVTGATFESELVWEGWYNQSLFPNGTPVDQWVTTSNMQNQKFWYMRPPGTASVGVDVGNCTFKDVSAWEGGVPGSTIQQLLGGTSPCIASNALVTGVAVGVGSRWPLPWHGYVDNIQMGFGTGSNQYQALNTNFDLVPTTVPEPSTWALMLTGLAAVGYAARRRRSTPRNDQRNDHE
jgi:hypothetical protein